MPLDIRETPPALMSAGEALSTARAVRDRIRPEWYRQIDEQILEFANAGRWSVDIVRLAVSAPRPNEVETKEIVRHLEARGFACRLPPERDAGFILMTVSWSPVRVIPADQTHLPWWRGWNLMLPMWLVLLIVAALVAGKCFGLYPG